MKRPLGLDVLDLLQSHRNAKPDDEDADAQPDSGRGLQVLHMNSLKSEPEKAGVVMAPDAGGQLAGISAEMEGYSREDCPKKSHNLFSFSRR